MKDIMDRYKNDKLMIISCLCFLFVISGVFGYVYEFIFYYFNGDMKCFYLQGGNFLPWINIYAYGAMLILALTYKFKDSPIKVFLISCISCGGLEYIAGFILYYFCGGIRYWDYNVEKWNFLNIDGFFCLRSVVFFGISGVFLICIVIPLLLKLIDKIGRSAFIKLSLIIFSVVMFDEIYNLLLTKLFHTPTAYDVYTSLGFKYVS